MLTDFRKLGENDFFGNIEIPFQKLDDILKLVSEFRAGRQTKMQRLVNIKEGLFTTTSLAEIPVDAEVYSFYSKSVHELFADLGAVLLAADPSILAKTLGSARRDFNRDLTFQQHLQEYNALIKYDEHTLLSYLRGVLWRDYFAKVPKTQWPAMIEAPR